MHKNKNVYQNICVMIIFNWTNAFFFLTFSFFFLKDSFINVSDDVYKTFQYKKLNINYNSFNSYYHCSYILYFGLCWPMMFIACFSLVNYQIRSYLVFWIYKIQNYGFGQKNFRAKSLNSFKTKKIVKNWVYVSYKLKIKCNYYQRYQNIV